MTVKKEETTPPKPAETTPPVAPKTEETPAPKPAEPAKDDTVSEKLDTLIDLIKGIIPGKKEEETPAEPDITAQATQLEVEVPPPTAPAKYKRYGIIQTSRKVE